MVQDRIIFKLRIVKFLMSNKEGWALRGTEPRQLPLISGACSNSGLEDHIGQQESVDNSTGNLFTGEIPSFQRCLTYSGNGDSEQSDRKY